MINEHVFEIRFKPDGRVFDHRGTIAESLVEATGLPHWKMARNRVDVSTKDDKLRAFVSFRNAGYVAKDTEIASYFPDKTVQFFRALSSQRPFGDSWHVLRVGVRSRFCTPLDITFEAALDRLLTRYVAVTEDALEAIGSSKIVDYNSVLICKGEHGLFQTQIGPMRSDQIAQYLEGRESYPEIGLFYDIDYYRREEETESVRDIASFINNAAKESWQRHDRVVQLLTGE